jgi:hypothetical protein
LPLLAAWCLASIRVLDRDPLLVFAGAIGISTYFAGTSWDYNLITTYPLLIVVFVRGTGPDRRAGVLALLVLGLVGILGHRAAFMGSEQALRLHLAFQWAFLFGTGIAAPWVAASRREDACEVERPRRQIPEDRAGGSVVPSRPLSS